MTFVNAPSATQNLQSVRSPTLKDVLDSFKRQILLSLNCHHIGTIQSFNTQNQTAKVTINYKKTYYKYSPPAPNISSSSQQTGSINYEPYSVSYPVLAECPVIVLGGSQGHLTFPIKPGDQCLLLFNDRDIDNWFAGQEGAQNSTARLHDFSDALAIVGLQNANNFIQNYDDTRILITDGNAKVGINPTVEKVTLQNNLFTLNTLLQQLCVQIEALATACESLTVMAGSFVATLPATPQYVSMSPPVTIPVSGTSSTPVNISDFMSIYTAVVQIANNIAQVLE